MFAKIKRVGAVYLASIALVGLTAGAAFGWNSIWKVSDIAYNWNPVFSSNNQGAYTLYGYYAADTGSFVNVCNASGHSDPSTICARASLIYGDNYGGEYTEWGDAALNLNGSGPYEWITSSHTKHVTHTPSLPAGIIGVSCWGDGWVVTYDGTSRAINTYYGLVLTTDQDGNYIGGDTVMRSTGSQEPSWTPGASNFRGSDGLLYGVPCTNDSGEIVVPDMCRVKLADGTAAYVSIDELNAATVDYATTAQERESFSKNLLDKETTAFQSAFAEYFGVDNLSYDQARDYAEDLRYENGENLVAQSIEANHSDAIASEIRNGSASSNYAERVSSSISENGLTSSDQLLSSVSAEDIVVTSEDVAAIYNIMRPQFTVSIPAYDEDGTILGQYSFVRM